MNVLVDTCVIVRVIRGEDDGHRAASTLLNRLLDADAVLWTAPQVCYELWVVAMRPVAVNGLGFDANGAHRRISELRQAFRYKPDPPELVERWADLCLERAIHEKRAHDVRLIAWMLIHGINDIATFNAADFAGFPQIRKHVPLA